MKIAGDNFTPFFLKYHARSEAPGGPGSVDDFVANPAGFVINGHNVTFDLGSVVDLNYCFGRGGTSGTCAPGWNALGLDGFVTAQGYASQNYGKYVSVNLDATELAAVGIGSGSNSVLLSTCLSRAAGLGRPGMALMRDRRRTAAEGALEHWPLAPEVCSKRSRFCLKVGYNIDSKKLKFAHRGASVGTSG